MSLPPISYRTVVQSDLESVILPRLRDTVFHRTSGRNLYGIIHDRRIRTSRVAELETSWPGHSEASYAYQQDWVSLFDFRGVDAGLMRKNQDCLNPTYTRGNIAYLFLAEAALQDVIHSRDVPNTASFVPHVEAFYPSDLPLDLIDRVLCVTIASPRYLS